MRIENTDNLLNMRMLRMRRVTFEAIAPVATIL